MTTRRPLRWMTTPFTGRGHTTPVDPQWGEYDEHVEELFDDARIPPAGATEPRSPGGPAPEPGRTEQPDGFEADDPWRGRFEPFTVGVAGRAASLVVPRPDPRFPDRPDTVFDSFAVPDAAGTGTLAHVRAASVRGLSHRYYGRVRQDDYALRTTGTGRWVIAVVADGVSAGAHSHAAAHAASTIGARELAGVLEHKPASEVSWTGFLGRLAHDVREAIVEHLQVHGSNPDDAPTDSADPIADQAASTVVLAALDTSPDPDGRFHAHIVALGDTSAWVLRRGEAWEPLGAVKNSGEPVASSATAALPLLPPEPPQPTFAALEPGDVLVVMTDGLGDPLGGGTGDVGAFLAQAWAKPPTGLEFAAHVDFARRSYDDDRTAVAIWPVTL